MDQRTVCRLALLLLVGCGTSTAPGTLPRHAGPTPAARPRRDACLEAPWVATDESIAQGLSRRACGRSGGRQSLIERAGSRPATDPELMSLRERLIARLGNPSGLVNSGIGVCCDDEPGGGETCLRLSLELCSVREEDLARALREELRSLSRARVRVAVTLVGETGPRCAPPDRRCVPTPYDEEALDSYDPEGDRTPVSRALSASYARLSWGECAHDGECVAAGCGNQCVPWTEADRPGTCEGYEALEEAPAFCGCVSNRCTWFVQ
jgi:hypothetical protein